MRAADHLPERFNAAAFFVGRQAAGDFAGRIAIVTDALEWTYAQLDERVRRMAAALRQAGVRFGDRVALRLLDGPLFSTAFWGVIAAGGVAVPLNTQLTAESLERILGDCEPRLLVFDPSVGASPRPTGGPPAWTDAETAQRLDEAAPEPDFASTSRDDAAFMLYSSGTTGEPKGVVHLQHDAWICCRTFGEEILKIEARDRCFSIAKLFFAYGLGNAQYFPYDAGASAVLYPGRATPDAVFDQVRRHRPTLFFGVPTAYARMLAAMEGEADPDFSSVRLCVSAGEALPESVWRRWRERTGLEILDALGSTETAHCFLSNRPGRSKPGSSGRPVGGYEVRLAGEDGLAVERGEIGDLLVRGDSTMAFYWRKPEATKRVFDGDWIRTGDKYREDEDGFFWHAGRSDDMLKVSGRWVAPVEVEAALSAHPAVLECAVVAGLDADGLVKGHAFVALRPTAPRAGVEDSVRAFARERLEAHKCPRWITVVEELPKTATGKVQRFRLRERAGVRPRA